MAKPKKIGIVVSMIPAYSETFLISKIKGLQQSGFDVTVFSNHRSKQRFFFKHVGAYPSGGIALVFWFPFVLLGLCFFRFSYVKKFMEIAQGEGGRLIKNIKKLYANAHILQTPVQHLHFSFTAVAAERPYTAAAIGAKMTTSFRGFDIELAPLKEPGIYTNLWKFIDEVHTISDDLVRTAISIGMPENINIIKIVPALDIQKFNLKPSVSTMRPLVRIVSTGRLTWQKGFIYSIEAMKILNQHRIDFLYEIIGDGRQQEELKYQIHQNGLDDKVKLLGKLSHEETKKRLSQSDIYIQPSIQEGFCNAALEAQAIGLLTIVSDAGGLPENVLNGQTGWVVPARSPEALSTKILDILTMKQPEKENIVKNARMRIETEFSLEIQNIAFAQFFS
ncbi:MAG: colanic acid biosynthesis glycosyltransferase WcaL [Flavobacteriaceae bacterium]|nr:colanic acid biosynthesis glycosyltransferase WcaL [Flavobacteriaceae bacterium]